MLYKEFISALVMTGIVTAFAIPMTQLSGESQVVPLKAKAEEVRKQPVGK